MIITDEGGGITQESLKLFESWKGKFGEIIWLHVNRSDDYNAPLFSCEIHGMDNTMLLSGCNCGYGGEGPTGTIKILNMIFDANTPVMPTKQRDLFARQIKTKESYHMQFSWGQIKW